MQPIKQLIVFVSEMLLLAALFTSSCSSVRKSKKTETAKVDSSAISVNTYQRKTTTTETGSDSIANPVKPFIAPLNTDDTAEKTFETDIMTVKVKTGKNGKLSITPKQSKLPVPPSTKTTETKESGTNTHAVNKTTETKKVEVDKDVQRFPLGLGIAGILIVLILMIWAAKRYITP